MEHDIEKYEQLHDDYKKLMNEYEELKSNDASGSEIDQKLKELKIKQEEIHDQFSQINPDY